MKNKKGLSPLVATLLLVVFALVIGTATMNWGKAYVENIDPEAPDRQKEVKETSIIIPYKSISDDPLKRLQLRYIQDEITKDEYLRKEKELLNR